MEVCVSGNVLTWSRLNDLKSRHSHIDTLTPFSVKQMHLPRDDACERTHIRRLQEPQRGHHHPNHEIP